MHESKIKPDRLDFLKKVLLDVEICHESSFRHVVDEILAVLSIPWEASG